MRSVERSQLSNIVALSVFGAALALVIASCGRQASPTSPGAVGGSRPPGAVPCPEWPCGTPTPTPTPTPPRKEEGCTPGYWKQEQHLDSWTAPYTPTTLFNDVFADAFAGMTLVQVLELQGGGLDALGRHAVAALLSAASPEVDYAMSVADVIAAFDATYASGDYETLKNRLDVLNNQTCPLD
jgi:hypothetical protein